MTKFEDNISPYLSFVEGSAPSSPAATNFKLYYDSSDHLLKWKNSAGTVSTIATIAAAPTLVGCRVYHNANQALTNGAYTKLAFNSERFDSDAFHDTVTNNSRLTIPSGKDGYYLIGCNATVTSNASGLRFLELLLNNTTVIGVHSNAPVNGSTTNLVIASYYNLVATDYIEARMYVDQNSLNAVANPNWAPEFWCTRLAV